MSGRKEIHAVTGAFGFSGKYIAERLLKNDIEVRTLTNSPNRDDPLAGRIKAFPYNFERPGELAASLEGVKVLYNTYWVRFNYRDFSLAEAEKNSRILFRAAREAGVRKIVHVSIINASENSLFEYFRRKGVVERNLLETGISHAILRPAVLFGREDILINNIAWILRHFPVFFVFGRPAYRLQPIYVDDLAAIAVRQGSRSESAVINAIGPETFTFRELVREMGRIIGKPRPIVSIPPWLGGLVSRVTGKILHDVVVTEDEIAGLMADMLYIDAPPAGTTRLTEWLKGHADTIGRTYQSELARRLDRERRYGRY
jgi:NADH dehydrogenase